MKADDGDENGLGQPAGRPLPEWSLRPTPTVEVLNGRYCRLERLDLPHADELFAADRHDIDGASWTYLPYGPFADLRSYRQWVQHAAETEDPLFYSIIDADSTGGSTATERVGGA